MAPLFVLLHLIERPLKATRRTVSASALSEQPVPLAMQRGTRLTYPSVTRQRAETVRVVSEFATQNETGEAEVTIQGDAFTSKRRENGW